MENHRYAVEEVEGVDKQAFLIYRKHPSPAVWNLCCSTVVPVLSLS
jgi:hypothetical protein